MAADIIDNQQQEISASDKAFQLVSERFANARIRTQLLANVMEGYRRGEAWEVTARYQRANMNDALLPESFLLAGVADETRRAPDELTASVS